MCRWMVTHIDVRLLCTRAFVMEHVGAAVCAWQESLEGLSKRYELRGCAGLFLYRLSRE